VVTTPRKSKIKNRTLEELIDGPTSLARKSQRGVLNGSRKYDNPAFKTPNYPQAGVSWYEALAFCNWLSAETEFHITLPNEVEWERAARDTDGRNFNIQGKRYQPFQGSTESKLQ